MKNNNTQTEIVVVLDRSGSMKSIAPSTVEGYNKFLNEQQNSEGEAFITLIQFDDRYEVNYRSLAVKEAMPLVLGQTFVPRGGTALLDAIGKTIEELETERDVVFVIITDGEENRSTQYKHEAIKNMIETQTNAGWKFLFLAANQDAIQAGDSIGISKGRSMTYSADVAGASDAFMSFTSNISSYRSSKLKGVELADKDLDFNDEQRKEQERK